MLLYFYRMKLESLIAIYCSFACIGAVFMLRKNSNRFRYTYDDVESCSYSKFGEDHTMCQYTDKGCAVMSSGLDKTQAATILGLMNTLRNELASGTNASFPTATNMRLLKWDDELAELAQTWADQCKYQHDSNRQIERFKWVGQTIFLDRSYEENKAADVIKAVAHWASQINTFEPTWIKPFRLDYWTSDFSQLTWAKTRYVGCGYSFWAEPYEEYYNKLYVCNYGPGGNYPGESLYEAGQPCEFCDGACDSTYTSLCGTESFSLSHLLGMEEQ